MVAVVSGSGLGLFSGTGLNGNGQVGRGRDQVFVNTTTGNLVVQSVDETLAALGLDFAGVRTYNSQGLTDEDNNDNWRLGVHQRLLNIPASTNSGSITKVFGDGAEVVYTWNATRSRYESNDGDGANDFVAWNGSAWVWTDGSSRTTETYESVNGVWRIRYSRDSESTPNTVTYNYTGSLLTSIAMAGSTAQTVFFDYTDTGAAANNLRAIRVVSNSVTQTLTSYTYDSLQRLQTVTVDLTPTNTSDNVTYVTTYTYDSTSKRIASITQSDGSSVSFTYLNVNGDYRLRTVTDAENRTTTFNYADVIGGGGGSPVNAPAAPGQISTTDLIAYPQVGGALTASPAGWNGASRRELASPSINDPRIQFDANGNGFLIWRTGNNIISQRYTRATNSWGPEVILDNRTTTTTAQSLSVDASGNAIAAWVHADSPINNVYAARYDAATGLWSTAVPIDGATNAANPSNTAGYSLVTAINGSRAVVAWQHNQAASGSVYDLWVARFDGATLAPAVNVESGAANANQQSIAIDNLGNVAVAFAQSDGTNTNVYVNRFNVGTGTWAGPVARDTVTAVAADPRIQFDANGNGLLIYRTGNNVNAQRYTRSSDSWGTQVTLDTRTTSATAPVLALDAGGPGFAAWVQSDGTATSVYAARFDGTSWGVATLIDTLVANATFPVNTAAYSLQISVAGSRAALIWQHNQATSGSVYDLYTARFDGTSWQAPESIEALAATAGQPFIATDSLGNVTAAFMQNDGTANSAWVNRYNVAAAGSYYIVPAGATWQSIANAIYGINSAAAGAELQARLAPQTLATNVQLGGFPPTLSVSTTVPTYYRIVSGDTWAIVANKVYGTTDANAIAAMQTFAGSTTLPAVGQRLNVQTTLTYTPAGGGGPAVYTRTEVTDALGAMVTYIKDSAGRLTAVLRPSSSGMLETRYTYDPATGNVATITEDPTGLNRVTTLTYDANTGLLLGSRDSLGNTVTRTYNTNNQLETETSYLVRDPDGAGPGQPGTPLVTRYIYDAENHLRFIVSADGRVTEHDYDTPGQLIVTYSYAANPHSGVYGLTELSSWATGQRANAIERTSYTYDFRGNIETVSRWAATNSSGAGTGTVSTTQFVYDQRGLLLQTIDARGIGTLANRTTPNQSHAYSTTFTYDGLGRRLATYGWVTGTETSRSIELNTYQDATRVTLTQRANGLTTTDTFNRAGELISTAASSAIESFGTTNYTYDAGGNLRVHQDATGVKQYFFYDASGRLLATVDGDGSLTETIYNRANQVVKTVRYATLLPTSRLASLSSGGWATVLLSDMRTEANTNPAINQLTRAVYDISGALAYQLVLIDSATQSYAVTKFIYDGAGRLTEEMRYRNTFVVGASVDEVLTVTVSTHADDRRTRHFYNGDGQRIGTLDGAGYLIENVYDAAGRVASTIGYYAAVDIDKRDHLSLNTMRPGSSGSTAQLDALRDITTRIFYDAQGRKIGALDGQRYFTEVMYDVAGNAVQSIRYDRELSAGATTFSAAKGEATGALTHTTVFTYDGLGQVLTETNFENTLTTYTYDLAGNVTSATTGAGADARTTAVRYDALGRVTQELSGEGNAALAALSNPTTDQINDIWSRWGIKYTYDYAGRRTSTTVRPNDTQTNTTYYYYDKDGRLRFSLDPRGRVSENRYNGLGQLVDTIEYWRTVSISTPQGGVLPDDTLAGLLRATESANVHERTSYGYTVRGEVSSTSTVGGVTTSTSYNNFGEVQSRNSGTGFTAFDYTYDARGLQKLTTRAGVTFETRTYDAFGRLATVIDARNNTTTTTFDRLGRELSVLQPGDADGGLITYDAFSRIKNVRDKLGNSTGYQYNDTTRTVTVTTPEGIVVTTTHNVHGDTVTVVAAGNTTSYQYDKSGQLTGASDSLGALEGRGYDRAGRQVTATDARGMVTTLAYDAANRILSRTVDSASGGLALVTTYAYDTLNRILNVTEPGNRLTRTEYDRDGRVAAVIVDPNGATPSRTEYVYDAANNVVTVTQGAGSTLPRRTRYVYDALGRRSDEYVDPTSLGGTLNLRTQYRYDNNNNLTRKIDANNNSTWYTYDAQNRLVQTIDALGGVTSLSYDAEDRVVATRRHFNTATTGGLGETPAVQSIPQTPSDQVTRSVYDRDGRERFTLQNLSATGSSGNVTSETAIVTERTFDAAGRVARTRVYNNTITVPGTINVTNVGNALVGHVDDRQERTVYDLRGRVEITIDGVGAVTRYEYDLNGNVTQRTEYANTVPVDGAMRVWYVPATNSSASRYLGNFAAGDVVTATVRFKAPSDTSGAMFLGDAGGPDPYDNALYTGVVYGNDGWITLTLTHTMSHADDMYVYVYGDRDGAYANSSHSVLYDNLKVTSAQRGTLVDDQFDGTVGDYSQSGLQQAATVTIADAGNDAAIRSLVTSLASSTQDRVTRFWYDTLDRARFSLDTEGYLAETRYLDSTRQEQAIVYAGKPSIGAGATLANVVTAAGAAPNQSLNQVTTQTFDVAGRVVQVNDANNRNEYFVYDAVGNKIRYVNQKAASASDTAYTWIYEYDANHRLVYERSPAVSVTTVTENGETLDVATNSSLVLVTHNFYDALGNLTSRVEAEGTTQARTTSYEYDLLGRQIATVSPTVGVYTGGTADTEWGASGATVLRRETSTRIRSETAYDVFGNAFRHRLVTAIDAATPTAGTFTYKAYDTLGRVKYEIDAKRQVTSYVYDTFGNKTQVTRHGNVLGAGVTLPNTGNAGLFASQLSAPTGTNPDRTIWTTYDRLNRSVSVRQPNADHFIANVGSAGGAPVTLQPTVEYQYNAFGDVVRTRELTASNTWATSYAYYDKRSLKVADIDSLRYLTRYFYDDETGDLTSQIEYARPTTGTVNVDSYGTIVTSANGNASGDDRQTNFTYDKLNRKVTETRVNLEYSYINGSNNLINAFNGTQVTTYGYDALGNQTTLRVSDPVTSSNVDTYTYYDALGRVIATAQPGRVNGNGQTLYPFTRVLRDAHGNVAQQIEYFDSLASAPTEGTLPTAPSGNPTLNRTSATLYDGRNNAVASLDAVNGMRKASYNARGDIAKEWQRVVNPNVLAATSDDIVDTVVTLYRYDEVGQQKEIVESQRYNGASSVNVTRVADFNAFGEIIAKYNQGAAAADRTYYDYDALGRVWRTNADDGVDKVYMYDLQGNATVELRSRSIFDLGSASYASATAAAAAAGAANLMRTETAYDLHGKIIERRMPTFETSNGLPPVGTNLQLSAVNGSAYVNWTGTLSATVTEIFEYRPAGSTGSWTSINIEQLSASLVGANVHSIYNASYEYRIRYTRGVDASVFAESTGTFRVDRGINTNYAISVTPPDTSLDVAAIAIQQSGPINLVAQYNGSTGWNGFAWQGWNNVLFNVGSIGPGPYRVYITYTQYDHNNPSQTRVDTKGFDWNGPEISPSGILWTEGSADYGSMLGTGISIQVYGGAGYSQLIAQTNAPAGPPMLIWAAPADTSVTATFKYKTTAQPSYSSVQAQRFGTQFRIDVANLLTSTSVYDYEIEYWRAGEVVSRRGGQLNSSGVTTTRYPNGTLSDAVLNAWSQNIATPAVGAGYNLQWTAPPSTFGAVTATFGIRTNGSSGAFAGRTINTGPPYSVYLGDLPQNQPYEYQIVYTLGGRTIAEQRGVVTMQFTPASTTTNVTGVAVNGADTVIQPVAAVSGVNGVGPASGALNGTQPTYVSGQGGGYWMYNNEVDVSFATVPASMGAYTRIGISFYWTDGYNNSGGPSTYLTSVLSNAAGTGSRHITFPAYYLTPTDPSNQGGRRINSVASVNVYLCDAAGNNLVAVRSTGATGTGGTAVLQWAAPTQSGLTTQFYVNGTLRSTSTSGTNLLGDVAGYTGTNNYEIRHFRSGDPEAIVSSSGQFSSNGITTTLVGGQSHVSRNPSWIPITANGNTVTWSRVADQGSYMQFEYYNGSSWVPVTINPAGDNINFSASVQGLATGTYQYRLVYASASSGVLPYVKSQGTFSVTTTIVNNTTELQRQNPHFNQQYGPARIQPVTLPANSDVVSWSYPKTNASDTVKFFYTVGGTEYTVDLSGNSGPNFSAQMSALPIAANQSITWRIEYRTSNQYPYAMANGTATVTVTGTQQNPVVTVSSQGLMYPSGVQSIAAPTDLGSDYFGWSSLSPSGGAAVRFYLNGVETTMETIGSGRRLNLAGLNAGQTYNYELTFTASGASNPYARVRGTFVPSKSPGGISNTNFTIAPPRAESTFDVTPAITSMPLVWPPNALYYMNSAHPGDPSLEYGPRSYEAGGGYVITGPPRDGYPYGTYIRHEPPLFHYWPSAQAITWARTGGAENEASFYYWSLSDPTNVKNMSVGGYDTAWAAYPTDSNGDMINLANGTYGYRIEMRHSGSGIPYGVQEGTFTRSAGSYTAITRNTNTTPVVQTVTPTMRQTFDRWGNLLETRDASSNITNYRYNGRDQLVQTLEATDRMYRYAMAGGSTDVTGRAEKTNHYDLLGRLLETQDGYDQATRVTYNAVGQVISNRGADWQRYNATSTSVYDTFGNVIQTTDELGYKTRYKYDKAGRVIEIAREITHVNDSGGFAVQSNPADTTGALANVQRQYFVYDQQGRRVSETSGIDTEITRYRYDHRGNITFRMTPAQTPYSVGTTYVYDLNGKMTSETDALGSVKSWAYNAFGRLDSHTELTGSSTSASGAGATIVYNYNEAGQLSSQTNGRNISFGYDAAGNLTSVLDLAINRQTLYRYDAAGRRSRETVFIDGRQHQDVKIGYDAHNRINNLDDPDYREQIRYDANGNRSYVAANYLDHGNHANSDIQYYAYDEMNRVLTSSHYTHVLQMFRNTQFTYNGRGDRVAAILPESSMWERRTLGGTVTHNIKENQLGVPINESYSYDGLGRLKSVTRDVEWVSWTGSWQLISRTYVPTTIRSYTYDNANRVYTDTSTSFEGGDTAINRVTTNFYDLDGRASTSTTRRNGINIESVTTFGRSTYGGTWAIGYDDAGTLRGYTVAYHNANNGNHQYTVTYKNSYKFGESYLETQQSVNRSDNSSVTNYFTKDYNTNGELIRTADSESTDRTRHYANNQSGQALTVINGNFGGSTANAWDAAIVRGNFGGYGDNYAKAQYYFFANDNLIGTFGQLQKDGAFSANFDTNYTPISDSYPASVPSTVIAQAGDTLRSIATKVFGDSNLWYILAEENGLTNPDADLPDGLQLRIPNDVISLTNTADSFKPFNPADAIGDTSPTMPPPPAPKGCGIIGMIIMIVVMIVVTVFTAGAMLAPAAASFGTIMATGASALAGGIAVAGVTAAGSALTLLGASAVAGAVGSIVSQGVGIAIGAQEKFDWKAVGMAAIGSAVGSGLGGLGVGQAAAGAIGLTGRAAQYGAIAFNAAAGSALTQGIGVATGLQSSFSWREVAISAVSAPIAAAAGNAIGGAVAGVSSGTFMDMSPAARGFGANFASQLAGGFTGVGVRVAIEGKVDTKQLLADAFGNALGNSLVDMFAARAIPAEVRKLGAIGIRGYERARERNLTPQQAAEDAKRYMSGYTAMEGMAKNYGLDYSKDDLLLLADRVDENYLNRRERRGLVSVEEMDQYSVEELYKDAGIVLAKGDDFMQGDASDRFVNIAAEQSTKNRDSWYGIVKDAVDWWHEADIPLVSDVMATLAGTVGEGGVFDLVGAVDDTIHGALAVEASIKKWNELAATYKQELGAIAAAGGVALLLKRGQDLMGIHNPKIQELVASAIKYTAIAEHRAEGLILSRVNRVVKRIPGADRIAKKLERLVTGGKGAKAEILSAFILDRIGVFTDSAVLQNTSGHGLDYMGKTATGEWVSIEIKATSKNNITINSFNANQRLGADAYTNHQLERIANGTDNFIYTRMESGDSTLARRILQDQRDYNRATGNIILGDRPEFRGYVVGLTNYDPARIRLPRNFQVEFLRWQNGLPGYPRSSR